MSKSSAEDQQLAANYLMTLRRLTAQTHNNADIVCSLSFNEHNRPEGLSRMNYDAECVKGIEDYCKILDETLDKIAAVLPFSEGINDQSVSAIDTGICSLFNASLWLLKHHNIMHDRCFDAVYGLRYGESLVDKDTTANIHGYRLAHKFLKESSDQLRQGVPLAGILENLNSPQSNMLNADRVLNNLLQDHADTIQDNTP